MVRRVVRGRDIDPRVVLEMEQTETVRIVELRRVIRDADAHGRNKSRRRRDVVKGGWCPEGESGWRGRARVTRGCCRLTGGGDGSEGHGRAVSCRGADVGPGGGVDRNLRYESVTGAIERSRERPRRRGKVGRKSLPHHVGVAG